jgi:hypothetical protein
MVFSIFEVLAAKHEAAKAAGGSADPLASMSSMGQFTGGTKKDKDMQSLENWFSNTLNSIMGKPPSAATQKAAAKAAAPKK